MTNHEVTFTVKFPQNAPSSLSPNALRALIKQREEEKQQKRPPVVLSDRLKVSQGMNQNGSGGGRSGRQMPVRGRNARIPQRQGPRTGYALRPQERTQLPQRQGDRMRNHNTDASGSLGRITIPRATPLPFRIPSNGRLPVKAVPMDVDYDQRNLSRMQIHTTRRQQEQRQATVARSRGQALSRNPIPEIQWSQPAPSQPLSRNRNERQLVPLRPQHVDDDWDMEPRDAPQHRSHHVVHKSRDLQRPLRSSSVPRQSTIRAIGGRAPRRSSSQSRFI